MKTATYFQSSAGTATTLYHDDGKTPYHYWNILLRPAGSINASANDMAAYLQFYLNRGAVAGKQLVPAADIDRMETPASTWAAKDGLKAGYGLSNYWSVEDGFVYHGHDGGVEGGLTQMAYMADNNVGYFFSINSGNGDAFDKVAKAIRAYLTNKLQKPPVPAIAPLPPAAAEYGGWYVPDSPRVELIHFAGRVFGVTLARFRDGNLNLYGFSGWGERYVPVSGMQFRHIPKKSEEAPDPVATFALLTPNQEGRFIQAGFNTAMKQIPAWVAIAQTLLTAYVVLAMAVILIYAPFWILGGLIRRRRRPGERAMRLWPLIAVLSLIAFVGIVIVCSDDLIDRLGNFTAWSAGLWLTTVVFAIASVASAISTWRAPVEAVRPSVRRLSAMVTVALLIATTYLASWGIIGLRSWA